jgi:hypothetical protein
MEVPHGKKESCKEEICKKSQQERGTGRRQ